MFSSVIASISSSFQSDVVSQAFSNSMSIANSTPAVADPPVVPVLGYAGFGYGDTGDVVREWLCVPVRG